MHKLYLMHGGMPLPISRSRKKRSVELYLVEWTATQSFSAWCLWDLCICWSRDMTGQCSMCSQKLPYWLAMPLHKSWCGRLDVECMLVPFKSAWHSSFHHQQLLTCLNHYSCMGCKFLCWNVLHMCSQQVNCQYHIHCYDHYFMNQRTVNLETNSIL